MALYVTRWGEAGPRPTPDPALDDLFGSMTAFADVVVRCPPTAAWALVADITRIGEFSPECVDAWWLPGPEPGTVGARFEGRNREEQDGDAVEWIRLCVVDEWVEGERFAWLVGDRYDGTPATRWSFEVSPAPEGTRLTQRFAHLPGGLSGLRAGADARPEGATAVVAERLAELRQGMAQTLGRMRAVLEADRRP